MPKALVVSKHLNLEVVKKRRVAVFRLCVKYVIQQVFAELKSLY